MRAKAEGARREIRVAWLMPSLMRGYYWQGIFGEFSRLFPNTLIFTGLWPGYAARWKGTFEVRVLPGVRFIRIKRNPAGYDSGFTWTPPSILWELIRFRPDVILTNGFNMWTVYALALKAFTGWRVILIWEGGLDGHTGLDVVLRKWVRRLAGKCLDAAISNTRSGLAYLRDRAGIAEFKLVHHPYEVPDVNLFQRTGESKRLLGSTSSRTFLFVGQLICRKGIYQLLDACRLLAQKEMRSFSVLIIGDGEEAGKLRRRIGVLGLEEYVRLIGAVSYEDLGAYFRGCDVFILPTLEDIWGMVVLEAMASGKPVLCSRYAGSREMVEHGGNGFVFDPHNSEELAEYMSRFIVQPDLSAHLGWRSMEIIRAYTPERAAEVLAMLISRVLDSGRAC